MGIWKCASFFYLEYVQLSHRDTYKESQTFILNLKVTGHINKSCGWHNPFPMYDGCKWQGTLSLPHPSACTAFPKALDNANPFFWITPLHLTTCKSPASLLPPCCSSLATCRLHLLLKMQQHQDISDPVPWCCFALAARRAGMLWKEAPGLSGGASLRPLHLDQHLACITDQSL